MKKLLKAERRILSKNKKKIGSRAVDKSLYFSTKHPYNRHTRSGRKQNVYLGDLRSYTKRNTAINHQKNRNQVL